MAFETLSAVGVSIERLKEAARRYCSELQGVLKITRRRLGRHFSRYSKDILLVLGVEYLP